MKKTDEQKSLIERYYKVIEDCYTHDKIGHEQMIKEIHRIFKRLSVIGCYDPELKVLVDYHVYKKTLTSEQLIESKLQRLEEIKNDIPIKFYNELREELLNRLNVLKSHA